MDDDPSLSKRIATAFHPKYTLKQKQLLKYKTDIGAYDFEGNEIDDALERSREKLSNVLIKRGIQPSSQTVQASQASQESEPMLQLAQAAQEPEPMLQPPQAAQSTQQPTQQPPPEPQAQPQASQSPPTPQASQQPTQTPKKTFLQTIGVQKTPQQIQLENEQIQEIKKFATLPNNPITPTTTWSDDLEIEIFKYIKFYEDFIVKFTGTKEKLTDDISNSQTPNGLAAEVTLNQLKQSIKDNPNIKIKLNPDLIKLIKNDTTLLSNIRIILSDNRANIIRNTTEDIIRVVQDKFASLRDEDVQTRNRFRRGRDEIIKRLIGENNILSETSRTTPPLPIGITDILPKLNVAFEEQIKGARWNPFRRGGTRKIRRFYRSKNITQKTKKKLLQQRHTKNNK